MKKQYKTTLYALSIREGFSIQKLNLLCYRGIKLFYLPIPNGVALLGGYQEDIALKHKEQKGHLNILHITGTNKRNLGNFVNKIINLWPYTKIPYILKGFINVIYGNLLVLPKLKEKKKTNEKI